MANANSGFLKIFLFLSFSIMAFASFSYAVACEQASYPACFGTCANVEYECNNTITFEMEGENCLCDCPGYLEKVLDNSTELEIDGMKLRLGEVYFDKGEAFVKIFDENGNYLGEVKVSEGGYAKFTNPKTGNSILIKGIRVAPPSSSIWAEVSLFTDEITLEHDKRYNLASSDDPNWANVRASLLWKNREASALDGRADSLREIALYVDDMSSYIQGSGNRMVAGDSVAFPKIGNSYTLEYSGLDLQSADYEGISISVDSGEIVVANADNCNIRNAKYDATLIRVSVNSRSNLFGGGIDALGGDETYTFLIDPTGNFSLNGTDQYVDSTKANSLDWTYSTVFWKATGCDYYKMNRVLTPSTKNISYINTTILTSFTNTTPAVKFSTAGDDAGAYGAIRWYFVNNKNANTKKMQTTPYYGPEQLSGNIVGEIVLQEDAGKRDITSHYPVMTRFPVYKGTASVEFWKFKSSDSDPSVAYYSGINDSDKTTPTHVQFATSYPLPLYTDRGTNVTEVSSSTIYLYVATKVGYANFDFENSYQFTTLIHDAIDKTPNNRVTSLQEDIYDNPLTFSDIDQLLSPLRGSFAPNHKYLYRIGEDEYSGFATQKLVDQQASSDFTYSEQQGYWVGSSADPSTGVYYDSGDAYRQIVAKPNIIAYNMKFFGNDWGIPICTAGLSKTGDWASCTASYDRTDDHRLKIWFLGEEWLITNMSEPAIRDLYNSVGAKPGGLVKLAKEAKYDILNINGVIDGGDFKARLVKVLPGGNAFFDILDANGKVLAQITVSPGQTYTFIDSSTGKSIKIHLYRASPGFQENWTEIRAYGPCPPGQEYNNETCKCEFYPTNFSCNGEWNNSRSFNSSFDFCTNDCDTGYECNAATCLCEPILEPLTFSCNQNFTQNRSYIKDFDFCTNDCPENKDCSANSCKCECNQTQRNACQYPNIWNEKNCSCQIVEYCGAGDDAGICALPCQNKNKQCVLESPDACSCICEGEQSCKDPKTFNNQTCSCLCPAQDTVRISLNDIIDGGNYDLRIMKMGENNGAKYANIEIRGKDGSHKWWYPLGEGESRAYYNSEGQNGISFSIIEINADESWVEIIIHSDCPKPKKYSTDSCACYCPSELKANCTKPHIWNESNCTCEYVDALNFSCNQNWAQNRSYASNFDYCTDDCPQDFLCNENSCICEEKPKDSCTGGIENNAPFCTGICVNENEVCAFNPKINLSNLSGANLSELCTCQRSCYKNPIDQDRAGDEEKGAIRPPEEPRECDPLIREFELFGLQIPDIYILDAGCGELGCNFETGLCIVDESIIAEPPGSAKICIGACPPGLECSVQNSQCDCVEPPQPCGFVGKPYSEELGEPYYSANACTGYCEDSSKQCYIAGMNGIADSKRHATFLDAYCTCECGIPTTLVLGASSSKTTWNGFVSIRLLSVEGSGATVRMADAKSPYGYKEEQVGQGGTATFKLERTGENVYFKISKISSYEGQDYVVVIMNSCPAGETFDAQTCSCIKGGIATDNPTPESNAFVPWYE